MVSKKGDLTMMGCVDAGYMSDPHNAISETSFVFLCGGSHLMVICEADPGGHINQPLRDNCPIRSRMRICLATTDNRPNPEVVWYERC